MPAVCFLLGAGGIYIKFREYSITISEQNAIPAQSQWGWQRAPAPWIHQTLDVLPMLVNAWLSQNIPSNYQFNTRGDLLSASVGFFCSLFLHSLGHIQLCPPQLPHWQWQRALPLSSLYLSYPFLHYDFFSIANVCPSSALHFLLAFETLCSGEWIFNWLRLAKNSSIRERESLLFHGNDTQLPPPERRNSSPGLHMHFASCTKLAKSNFSGIWTGPSSQGMNSVIT